MPPGLNDDDGARVGHHSAHDVVVEPLPQIIAGDVAIRLRAVLPGVVDDPQVRAAAGDRTAAAAKGDARKCVGWGTTGYVRLGLGGRRFVKKNRNKNTKT